MEKRSVGPLYPDQFDARGEGGRCTILMGVNQLDTATKCFSLFQHIKQTRNADQVECTDQQLTVAPVGRSPGCCFTFRYVVFVQLKTIHSV